MSMPKSQELTKTSQEVSNEPSIGSSHDITNQSTKFQDLSPEGSHGMSSAPSGMSNISKTIKPSADASEAKRKPDSDMPQVIPGEINPKEPGRSVQSDNSEDSSFSKNSFYRKANKSGDGDSSMMYSPESSQTNFDAYKHESFHSMQEKSKIVNTSNCRSNKPIIPRKKGSCAGCGRGNFLLEKEYCMACGIKYCGSCVISMMGSMPEGRKCIKCLGQPVAESRMPYIGKPSKLLKHLVNHLEVQQVMKAEKECPANQLRPEQVVVNNRQLSYEELAVLLCCQLPPVELKPGKYWYDGQTGLWGKEGHRPDKIITPSLKVGGNLQRNASNGKTRVFMNGRELGKLELKMLKLAGVNCILNTHLWVEHDGSYSEEGFKNIKGNIWAKNSNLLKKAFVGLFCSLFSMPTPQSAKVTTSERQSNYFLGLLNPWKIHKLLLLGHEGSGRSTVFKQAKVLYNNGYTKEELACFKSLIQANIYKYMAILLEGREYFEEVDDLVNASACNQLRGSFIASAENNNHSLSQPDIAESSGNNDDKQKPRIRSNRNNLYRLEPSMKQWSDWFMQYVVYGNSDSFGNSSTTHVHDHISKIELLWRNTAIQATFHRRSELPFLPDAASFFLDRVAEFCRSDYEPSEMDILKTEGLTQGSGLVQIEITLDEDTGSWRDVKPCSGIDRYHVIRVGGKGMSDNHKWLDMFENVRAVIFCVALSDYDLLMSDGSGNLSNKMIQTRDLFESILRRPCFRDTSFVLLLNKYDIFEGKIEQGAPLSTCTWFWDFRPEGASRHSAQSRAHQAYQYIAHKYKELFNSVSCTGRKLFTFQLNALDKTTVSGAFNYVKEILKWEEHKSAGWCIIPDDTSSYTIDMSSLQVK